MTTQAVVTSAPERSVVPLDHRVHPAGVVAFLLVLLVGLVYAVMSLLVDTAHAGEPLATGTFLFLGLALLIALGFEFVNGFHDTANAVATVIYTNALSPVTAVVWSGLWNFAGVVLSSGAIGAVKPTWRAGRRTGRKRR